MVCPPCCIPFYKGGIAIFRSFTTFKLIRYAVAYVFITSGFMKLLNANLANHFIGLGLPYPYILLNTVILLEIVCGILIMLNKSVRNAVIPLIAIMIAAIILTKVPTVHTSILQFAFNARLDIVMLILLIVLYNRNSN
ncbi:DoxX family protein [Bacillus salipaludis]|uniref:DoxX family protein n=1 Tax=Bacillus salipaludis TaxID=2547811 RepID=UPI003D1A2830